MCSYGANFPKFDLYIFCFNYVNILFVLLRTKYYIICDLNKIRNKNFKPTPEIQAFIRLIFIYKIDYYLG